MDKSKSYLDIGCGINFLKHIGNQEGFNIKSSDIEESNLIFGFIRNYIGNKVDFYNNKVNDIGIIVNTTKRFDGVVLSRFVPFEHENDIKRMISTLSSLYDYADEALVIILKESYDIVQEFAKLYHDCVIKEKRISSSTYYTFDLKKVSLIKV
jgi:nitrogen regulatory protein PII-like uncharacterized protein